MNGFDKFIDKILMNLYNGGNPIERKLIELIDKDIFYTDTEVGKDFLYQCLKDTEYFNLSDSGIVSLTDYGKEVCFIYGGHLELIRIDEEVDKIERKKDLSLRRRKSLKKGAKTFSKISKAIYKYALGLATLAASLYTLNELRNDKRKLQEINNSLKILDTLRLKQDSLSATIKSYKKT